MERDKPILKSLYKGLKLLDHFDATHPERGVKELADLSGMLKSTVYNILNTLQLCGFLEKSAAAGKYRLGRKILELNSVLVSVDETRRIIKPFMDRLAEDCNETVYFAQPHGLEVSYIDSSEPKSALGTRVIAGVRAEMYCTGLGKAMLAFLGEDVIREVLAQKKTAYTPYTLTDEQALLHELEETRRRGYAIDNMEHEYGIRCVAMPLRNHQGRLFGAISISGPSLRITDEVIVQFAEKLAAAAQAIQTQIRY